MAEFARRDSDASTLPGKAAPRSVSGDLRIGNPDDSYEQEANRIAREATEGEILQHWSLPSSDHGTAAPPIVRDVLNSPGQPLDRSTREYFESRLGHDFSKIRIHSDAMAAE